MRRNSSPTALADSSRESWTDAVGAKALVFRDSDSEGPRGPWTKSCFARSGKGGGNAFEFIVQSVQFSWRALWACQSRSWHTKRIPTTPDRTSTESPAERDALSLTLERDLQRIDRRTGRSPKPKLG
jgi:hypothetical protein